ncbi:alpha-hydroxy acid oxidase [Paremcibacter congregatus]|nr:alpha-hydroxy acid oxidase [Paremcibacter congregatus]
MMSSIESCYNLMDFRALARRRLPRMIFDYLDGGADDEVTLQRNLDSFGGYQLLPRVLRDVGEIDLSTTVQGQAVDLPVLLSPTGQTRMFHPDGERAVARAAAQAGTIYALSSVSSTSIEETAQASDGPKWFQIYVWRDREVIKEFIARSRQSHYQALCLTVDLAVTGNRERDLRNGLTFPTALNARTLLDILCHPRWLMRYLTTPKVEIANVGAANDGQANRDSLLAYISAQFDPTVTWADGAWMVDQWRGPFLIKGIATVEDAVRAVEIGASGIILSNHGGRQLDYAPAALDILPEVVAAVGGRTEILIDGGVRRGTDVIKALALGATAVMMGRPYLYALAAGGEAGVRRMFDLLQAEMRRDMALLGCRKISDLSPDMLRHLE